MNGELIRGGPELGTESLHAFYREARGWTADADRALDLAGRTAKLRSDPDIVRRELFESRGKPAPANPSEFRVQLPDVGDRLSSE